MWLRPGWPLYTRWTWLVLLLLVSCLLRPTSASIGDRSLAYQRCVSTCISDICNDDPPALPLLLRLTFWSCPDDCSYSCMHNLTSLAISPSIPYEVKLRDLPGLPPNRVVQYHGKWPFYRFLGIQEPFSVLFSVLNMYMHVKYGLSMRHRLPGDLSKPLRKAYRCLPLAGINLWIWSTVFHTRDKSWTEKMDYFSAAASMMCNLYLAIVRLGGLYPTPNQPASTRGAIARPLLLALLSAIFICHISYLTFWRFDYGYNMAFNVGIGLLHNLMWSAWSLYHYLLPALPSSSRTIHSPHGISNRQYRALHYARPFLILTGLSLCMAMELFDFPAFWRAIDAHSVWHFSTIPVIKLWYDCLIEDAWWLMGRKESMQIGRRLAMRR